MGLILAGKDTSLEVDKNQKVIDFSNSEKTILKSFIEKIIGRKKGIGNYIQCKEVNKLNNLLIATEVGLKIADTLVSSHRSYFRNISEEYIIKPISEVVLYRRKRKSYMTYTSIIKEKDFLGFPKVFDPILLQKRIVKKFEIRVFYLKGKCYSMAIFSQRDQQTIIDFRRYNKHEPNRTVPFKLPEPIENKIRIFMEQIHLDSGSIDFIVDNNDSYYFLEVNPVGQFGMVSNPCNYYLHKIIAEELIFLNSEK